MTRCKFTVKETSHSEIVWYNPATDWIMSLRKGDMLTVAGNTTYLVQARTINLETMEVEYLLGFPED